MKKVVAVILAVCVAFFASWALAQNPHFIASKTVATIQSDGDLVVKFKEAGLGDSETTYVLHATAVVTCQCVTKSGRCPDASNKVTEEVQVSTTGTFSPKNGTVQATLTITAPACPASIQPTCGQGQHLVLSEITYTDIMLMDITNNVRADLPDTLGVTLFRCP